MDDPFAKKSGGLYVVKGFLIVPVAAGLDEDELSDLKQEILERLGSVRVKGVLINMSAVSILGSFGFSILRDTANAIRMMGSRAVFVGFQPGVAAALVDFEADFSDMLTAVSMEDALELLTDTGAGAADEADEAEQGDDDPALEPHPADMASTPSES